MSTGTLTGAQVKEVAERLHALGVPDGVPKLEGITDTSDCNTFTHLAGGCGVSEVRPFHVFLSQMASGYRGPSAPAFAELCRSLLTMGGTTSGAVWDDLVDASVAFSSEKPK
jgi:hypothetical protein